MAKKNQLIKVGFKNSGERYVFMCEETITEKDIVICDTCRGVALGIVLESNLDISVLNDGLVYLPIKKANFICKSTHDLAASRNTVLKSMLDIYKVALYELSNTYDKLTTTQEEILPI